MAQTGGRGATILRRLRTVPLFLGGFLLSAPAIDIAGAQVRA